MFCCGCRDEEAKKGKPPHIRNQKRGCTDLPWLLLFVVSFLGVGYILWEAKSLNSDYNRVIRAVDFDGLICGVDEEVKDRPFGAWPNFWTKDISKPMICVKSCDETRNGKNPAISMLHPSAELFFYCIPTIVNNFSISITIEGDFNRQVMDAYEATSRAIGDIYTAKEIIVGSVVLALLVTLLYTIFLRQCARSLIYSLLFLITAFGLVFAQLLLDFQAKQRLVEGYPEHILDGIKYAGYTVMGLTGLFGVVVFFLRKEIDIAIGVTKMAASAMLDMQSIILFPIFPALLAFAYLIIWSWIGMEIYSIADLETQEISTFERTYDRTWQLRNVSSTSTAITSLIGPFDEPSNFLLDGSGEGALYDYRQISSDTAFNMKPGDINPFFPTEFNVSKISDELGYRMGYHVFHMLWVLQFLFYLGYMVFAGAMCDWYFTEVDDKGNKKRGDGDDLKLGRRPVVSSCFRSCKHHTGTVAVCAFIIAVVKFLRLVITYIEQKTKGNPPNGLQKAVFCAIKCYLKCLECCLDKINKYALVWTSIYGNGFCVSVCQSFALVWRNLHRVAAVNVVSHIVFFMGKVSVGLMSGAAVCLFLDIMYSSQVSSPLAPSMLVAVVGYHVAAIFFVMFSCTIDTLFLCFLVDCEASPGNMLAPKELQKLVGKYEKKSKRVAAQKHEDRLRRHNRSELSEAKERIGLHNEGPTDDPEDIEMDG